LAKSLNEDRPLRHHESTADRVALFFADRTAEILQSALARTEVDSLIAYCR
jgi:hypothetical protein